MMPKRPRHHSAIASGRQILQRATCASAALMLAACATGTSHVNKRQILVIGNSNYQSWSTLRNPINDKDEVCKVFRDDLSFEHVCKADIASKQEFKRFVDAYIAKLQPDSTGVFYYSGHGVQIGGKNYLVPTGAPYPPSADDLYPVTDLFKAIRSKVKDPTGMQMIVLDACRTDTKLRDATAPAATPAAIPQPRPEPAPRTTAVAMAPFEMRGSIDWDPNAPPRPASIGSSEKSEAPKESIILFATAANQGAFDGGADGHGPLTRQFLTHIKQRGLNIEDLVKEVSTGVRENTRLRFGIEQVPYTYQSFTGQFCFSGCFNPENFIVPVTP